MEYYGGCLSARLRNQTAIKTHAIQSPYYQLISRNVITSYVFANLVVFAA